MTKEYLPIFPRDFYEYEISIAKLSQNNYLPISYQDFMILGSYLEKEGKDEIKSLTDDFQTQFIFIISPNEEIEYFVKKDRLVSKLPKVFNMLKDLEKKTQKND